ncbi:non-ribosomal peptide synthetase, partial [Massilia aurea]|uniref:non-ribosomal peptide synthetase n=1 Tax=Massilia aurea TaxID=373040 RepID=UPI0031DC7D8C
FEDLHLSYGELNRRANRLAHRLIAQGVVPDARVAICVERSLDMIVGLLAILKAGGAYVPLDPAYPRDRLAHMLQDSTSVALLTHQGLRGVLPAIPGLPAFELNTPEIAVTLASQAITNPQVRQSAQHLAYVIYTSGSTGMPKGVMLEHRNVVNLVQGHIAMCELTPHDRVLQFASFSFDSSVPEIFSCLAAGAALVIRPPRLTVPDDDFATLLQTQRITIIDLPTAFWHRWAQQIGAGYASPNPDLRLILSGGERSELRHLATWCGEPSLHRTRWINNYGPTEAAVNATAFSVACSGSLPLHSIPIGRPVANTQIYILDPHGQPVPSGVTGEIHIGGAGVARGYLNRPELTAERFVADPFSATPGARMYKTGDLGRWLADGNIEYLGRNDFQVKIRGFRIELGEIEAKLAACPGVGDAVVVARENSSLDQRLVAYVIARNGAALDAASLRASLAANLPDYMLPAAFVILDAFPLTPNGKLDRKALPAPDQSAVASRGYEEPQGVAETAIAAIWQELLGLERVGRNDHFFELGGHSLLAVQVISRVRQGLGIEIALRDLFAHP